MIPISRSAIAPRARARARCPEVATLTPGQARLALFLAALVLRLAALGLSAATGRFPEFWEYEALARNLVGGKGFVYFHMHTEYRAYVEPLYPWLVAGTYFVAGHSAVTLSLLQCLISALVAVVVYDLGRRTFGHAAGVAAGVLVAVHPGLAAYASKFHPLVLDALFIALVVLATLRLVQEPSRGNAAFFGGMLGGCILTRPTILAFVLPALAWLAWRRSLRRAAASGALALAIVAVIVGPWVLRNYTVLGTFVLTRTNTAYVFWLGNHPGATGGATDPSGAGSLFDVAPPALKQRILSADEVTQNRIFLSEALKYVQEDPLAFIGRTIKKLYYFWWVAPYMGGGYSGRQVAIYRSFYSLALILAAIALLTAWRRPVAGQADGLVLALSLLAAISISQALFYVDGRHRLAVEPVLTVLSGHGLASLAAGIRRAGRKFDQPSRLCY